ncbi:unnamed protein product [Clonostachys rhizophaga]|uniref:CorA-like transporter domain-containing protein n=1 Tax=Clonostachys rhizophaga TaxID=160324 RepID=A0A9N9VPW1_9HYPO|nr:unnamed protein product [Clonostachys rhizophaga]
MQDIQMGNAELESFFKPDFEARLSDIFVTESASCKVGVVCLQKAPKQPTADLQSPNQNSEKSFVTWVSTLAHLKTALESQAAAKSRMIILHRKTSWSRVSITYEMFQAVYALGCTPHFLRILLGFIDRVATKDEDCISCYRGFTSPTQILTNQPETQSSGSADSLTASTCFLCYNIRYMELNHRKNSDPWSCRQSAISQQYSFSTKASTWIIVQPPMKFSQSVEKNSIGQEFHPMAQHVWYMTAGISCWREYLEYFATELRRLHTNILMFRGQETTLHNEMRLTQIVQSESLETSTMVSIASKTYNDSRTMRTMMMVTLFYLPANLVLYEFSLV